MMKRIVLILTTILILLSMIVIISCSDKTTEPSGNGRGSVPPFRPSEGAGWPPEDLLNAFNVGDWLEPAGMGEIGYIAYSEFFDWEPCCPTHAINIDVLEIHFEKASELTIRSINNYLNRNATFIESWEEAWGATQGSWFRTTGNNLLIDVYIYIHKQDGGEITLIRQHSKGSKFSWPNSDELGRFLISDFTKPVELNNVLTDFICASDYWSDRLFISFTGVTSQTITTFFNYFDSRATLVYQGNSDSSEWKRFRIVHDHSVFDYYYTFWNQLIGYMNFHRWETDLPPGKGTGWPQQSFFEPFTLEDWTEPIGLKELTWESVSNPWDTKISLNINFWDSTDDSIETIINYLSSKAAGSINHIPDFHISGTFDKIDENYSYNFYFGIWLSSYRGGGISVTRNCIFDKDDYSPQPKEHTRYSNPSTIRQMIRK